MYTRVDRFTPYQIGKVVDIRVYTEGKLAGNMFGRLSQVHVLDGTTYVYLVGDSQSPSLKLADNEATITIDVYDF